jgi:hypothetical protein
MQIKLIPETESERLRFGDEGEVVHTGVQDYFLAGVRKDEDSDMVDFHDWRGQYRFLLGSLQYFYEVLNDERRQKGSRQAAPIPMPPQTSAPKNIPNLQVVNSATNVAAGDISVIPAEVIPSEKPENKANNAEVTEENKEEYEETND